MSKEQSKLLPKLISVLSTTVIQAILIIIFILVYTSLWKENHSLGMGIALYYYQIYIFPLSMLVSNLIIMFSAKRYFILISFLALFVIHIYYWGPSLLVHPYRIGSLLLFSLILYVIGLFALSRLRDWLS